MDMIQQIIALALFEDSGLGDITSESILQHPRQGRGVIVAKQDCILAGTDVARKTFQMLDPNVSLRFLFRDGDAVSKGDDLLRVDGDLLCLLKSERVALNFLQRLSGIATLTREYAAVLKGASARLTDTRKTTPGWRYLEKEAVRAGGGYNHRFSLYDGILIKDNHIEVAGSISAAVQAVKNRTSHLMKIEVEVSTMDQVDQALAAGADVIMLDNMSIKEMAAAVIRINGQALVEASGNVSMETLKEIADTGVDVISCGALTHQARSVDLSMRLF
ncbi:carboxylating nicotinate-nucleotide diphosphorylase [Desulfotignum phosphitoxidans]|uniref:Probable nicotinate-nucleotide pyrophosphorylase [carboxylating] n=1 Tax=Desulfotignum phosphitoxidans DSM 13687 TaxID=1286635 RepID=S0FZS1_9BACT|nr:carboxylating nicotinate-nucleotide diphosphorylase [Desulfotignum phosphitoxidans]EMS80628.1 nadC nicotinate-nucleotide pyrophosphorylase [Desulfotignum phosphitoxidans DSM 13687]